MFTIIILWFKLTQIKYVKSSNQQITCTITIGNVYLSDKQCQCNRLVFYRFRNDLCIQFVITLIGRMRHILIYFVFLIVLPSTIKMDLKKLNSAVTTFSMKFCNELEKNKNVVSSPLSAEILLALITLGANDPAHSELLKALDFPDDEFIRSSFTTVSQKFKTIKGVTLNVANKVYIKEGSYDLAPEIKKDAVDVFDADFEKVDFGDSAAAAALINKWVESKTNERIKDLLESDSISDDTRLILVNALYFKGNWKKQFDVHATIDHPFHTSLTDTVNVRMMNMEDHFRYGEDQELDVKLLEMPYTGDEASMLIILPNQIDGLPNVMQKLANGYDIMGAVEKMFSTKVRVMVPRFKIETTIDLKELLPKLGINAIFNSQNSGLDRILNTPEKIYVSEAIQKAFIEVNEEGAEAAAATAGSIRKRRSLAAVTMHEFYVTRPALWCVLVDGRVVLAVRVVSPPPPPTASRPHHRPLAPREDL